MTTTNRKTSTIKTPINVKLNTLTTWDNIPSVGKAVSGTGDYRATFDWDSTKATGAHLDLGDTLAPVSATAGSPLALLGYSGPVSNTRSRSGSASTSTRAKRCARAPTARR